jgi:1-acyl-sn-glycerol-3-phosphate acyltransferase
LKKIGYLFFGVWIRTALTCYFSKIKVDGLHHVPSGKPLMFLANHQNALLDALLIATHCNRKPYFLTRSDVFKTSILKMLFEFLRMIPVYRIRDGKDSLKGNTAIFERCSSLLLEGEAILIFPEGNHSLQRRVRPLSKGFTRILFLALENNPSMEIGIIPIGVNYASAAHFPDKAALYYGREIIVQDFFDKDDLSGSTNRLKQEVYHQLKKLTAHIEVQANYDSIAQKLDNSDVDYLDPKAVNLVLEKEEIIIIPKSNGKASIIKYLFKGLFIVLNFPMIILWSMFIRPKVKELEFLSTTRFMFVLLFYPFQILFIGLGAFMLYNGQMVLAICLLHLILNVVLVKLQ